MIGDNAATNGAMILASYAQQGGRAVFFTVDDAFTVGKALDRLEDAHIDEDADFWGDTAKQDYESACWRLGEALLYREGITTQEANQLVAEVVLGRSEV